MHSKCIQCTQFTKYHRLATVYSLVTFAGPHSEIPHCPSSRVNSNSLRKGRAYLTLSSDLSGIYGSPAGLSCRISIPLECQPLSVLSQGKETWAISLSQRRQHQSTPGLLTKYEANWQGLEIQTPIESPVSAVRLPGKGRIFAACCWDSRWGQTGCTSLPSAPLTTVSFPFLPSQCEFVKTSALRRDSNCHDVPFSKAVTYRKRSFWA